MNNLYIEMVKNAKVNPKTHRCEFCDSDGQAIHIFPDGKNELEPHLQLMYLKNIGKPDFCQMMRRKNNYD